jgi:hypothetical protein
MTAPRRRILFGMISTVLILFGSVLSPSPGWAASQEGAILIKGPGSVYSGPSAYVSENVAAGSTDQFELQVKNTGRTLAQYNIKILTDGLPAVVDLYSGTLLLSPLPLTSDGYYTNAIPAGKTQALTLKVKIPAGSPQGSAVIAFGLYSTDGNYLSDAYAQTDVKAPTYGTSGHDIFAKQGSQALVGGSVNNQVMTSPALAYNASATYSVKLQNDGPSPTAIVGSATWFPSCASLLVKDGVTDVTASFLAGTYTTPVLAVHAAKTLTVTLKRTVAACSQPIELVQFSAHDPNSSLVHWVYIVAPYPATV